VAARHRRRARNSLRPSYGPPEHPEDEIAELEIPTGIPYRVTLDDGSYSERRLPGDPRPRRGGRSRRTPGRLVRG